MFQDRYKRWNKKIWIAKKIGTKQDDYGYEIPLYSKPKMYKMNVQPISSSADIQEFGENAKEMQKAVIKLKKYLGEFKEFDVAYLDGANPLSNGGDFIADVSDLTSASVADIDELEVQNLGEGKVTCYTCPNANYILYPPRNQNKVIQIYFKRLAGK